jgi:sugar (pentulose or hexulose) kinase
LIALASYPMEVIRRADGSQWFVAEQVWETTAAAARQVLEESHTPRVSAVGIASMAESGLLVEPASGSLRSGMIPWFDPSATPQAEQLRAAGDPQERFRRAGIRPNFKCSLAKLLWLRQREGSLPEGLVWLAAADYLAYRLTGRIGTDPSLQGELHLPSGRRE